MENLSIKKQVRKDKIKLKSFMLLSKFTKIVNHFFDTWRIVQKNKAGNKLKLIENYNFLQVEIIEKFEMLSNKKQKRVLRTKHPIKYINSVHEIKIPTIFPDPIDQEDFKNILFTFKKNKQ